MSSDLLANRSFWGAHGRLGRAHGGPFRGLLLLVWPDARGWQVVAEAPSAVGGDVRHLSSAEAAAVFDEWELEWMPLTRAEARLEAEVFGIRPSMDPAQGLSKTNKKTSGPAPVALHKAYSPGARRVAFPVFAVLAALSFAVAVRALLGESHPLFLLIGAILGPPSAWIAVRAWWVSFEITQERLILRGWLRRREFSRDHAAGFSVAAYHGGVVGIAWAYSAEALVSLRLLEEGGGHRDLHAIFGFPRRMRRVAAGLTLALDSQGR